MALVTVSGIYENGKIELGEKPEGVIRARVVVTFLPETEEKAKDEVARQRAFERMRTGVSFGGGKFNREEVYEERMHVLCDGSRRNPLLS